MHEHPAHLATTVVRLHLSEADRATRLHRRDDPHLSELGHFSRLGMERLRLRVLAETYRIDGDVVRTEEAFALVGTEATLVHGGPGNRLAGVTTRGPSS